MGLVPHHPGMATTILYARVDITYKRTTGAQRIVRFARDAFRFHFPFARLHGTVRAYRCVPAPPHRSRCGTQAHYQPGCRRTICIKTGMRASLLRHRFRICLHDHRVRCLTRLTHTLHTLHAPATTVHCPQTDDNGADALCRCDARAILAAALNAHAPLSPSPLRHHHRPTPPHPSTTPTHLPDSRFCVSWHITTLTSAQDGHRAHAARVCIINRHG